MIRNGIDWEGMGLNDISRYNKIRRVLKTELEETPYNIEYSTEFRDDIEYNESTLNEKLEEVLTTLTFREEKVMRLKFGYREITFIGRNWQSGWFESRTDSTNCDEVS
jgi:DNA-directed RNA polymerase sigma subunit (sigma70/sigma32)